MKIIPEVDARLGGLTVTANRVNQWRSEIRELRDENCHLRPDFYILDLSTFI